jgi:hypothetical protein
MGLTVTFRIKQKTEGNGEINALGFKVTEIVKTLLIRDDLKW